MKQKNYLLKLWMLLLCVVAGVGNVWGVETLYYTLDGTITNGGNSNYAQDGGGLTQDDIEWSVTGNTTINPWRIGGKNLSNVNREAYSKTAMGAAISKIELEIGSITLTCNSIKLVVASDASFSTELATITKTDITANATLTFSSETTEWASGAYYKFIFNVTAGSSNSYVQLKSAKFYKASSSGGGDTPSLQTSDLSLSGAPVALSFDLYNNSSAQTVSYTTSSTGAVTVSESEYVSCVVDETAKTITVNPTAVTPSAQTITVSQEADDTYAAGTATFTVTITDSTPAPTYTVTLGDDNTTLTQETGGAAVTLPTRNNIDNYTFAGWSETNVNTKTTTAPTIIPSGAYTPTADITLYPVYTCIESSGENHEEWVEIYTKPEDGTYVICSQYYFMSSTITSNRFDNGYDINNHQVPEISNGKLVVAPNNNCIWEIYKMQDGTYRIKQGEKYAAAKSSNNQGQMLSSETDSNNYTVWNINYTNSEFSIPNKGKNGKYLRNNSGNGWAPYNSDTGYAPRLFKKTTSAATTTYYWSNPIADTRAEAGISFAKANVSIESTESYTGQELTNPHNVSPITWTSSNENVATVEDGTISMVAPGETTITAAFAGNESYKPATVSYTLTINAHIPVLSSIALSGEYPQTFFVGDEFSHEGMTVTATYDDNSTQDVTSSARFSGYDMSTPGEQTVTVSYTEGDITKTATYTITVNELPKYTVTFSDGGSVTQASAGEAVTLPTRDAIGEYSFAGWSEANVSEETTTVPTIIPAGSYTPTADITLYPVYTRTEGGGGTTNKTADVTIADYATANNWSNGERYTSITMDENITATGKDNGNNSKYYSTSPGTWRHYASDSGEITITTTSGTLESVTFTYTGNKLTFDGSDVTSGTTVDVSGTSAVFSVSGSSSNTQVSAISVSYTISGGGTTYYWSSPVAAAVERPVITLADNPFYFSTTATITCATEGSTIKYSFDGENWSDYTSALTITETKTIYAKAVKGNDESTVAQVTVTKNLAEPTVTIDATGITNTNAFEGASAGSLSASVKYNDTAIDGATVTWSGNNDAVATINASTGAVTLIGAGSVTFTATYAGNGDYTEKTATYELTVTYDDPNGPGSEQNPYTVAQALDNTPSNGKVYVKGVVSKFVMTGVYSDNYHRYYISDDGSTQSSQLMVFNGKGLNNEDFTSDDDVQIGDIVTIYGNLVLYNTTKEFGAGNYIVSLKRAPAAPTFSPEAGTYTSVQTVEISCATDGAVIYYTTDGTDPTSESTEYTAAIDVNASMTIKAIAVKDDLVSEVATAEYVIDFTPSIVFGNTDNSYSVSSDAGGTNVYYTASNISGDLTLVLCDADGNETTYDWFHAYISSNYYVRVDWDANTDTENARIGRFKLVAGNVESAIYTVTQAKYVADYATLPFVFDNGKNAISTTSGLTQEGLGSDYASSPKLKFDGTGDYLILKINERPGTLTFDIKGNSFSGSTFKVQTSEDGTTYTDLKTYTELGDTQNESFNNLGENVRYIKWIYTNKSSGNVALGNIILTKPDNSPRLSVDPAEAEPFTYEEGGDLCDEQIFTVTGTNLTTEEITVSVTGEFELRPSTSGYDNISTLTISNGEEFGVNMKENLSEGTYRGTLTIASEGATSITISLTGTVTAPVPPAITVAQTTVSVGAAGGEGTIDVTYTKIDTDLVDVQFYTADGTEVEATSYDWIAAEISQDKKLSYVVVENTGEARTAYLKVYSVDDNGGDDLIYSDLITISQAAASSGDQFALFNGELVEGDYIIYYNGYAMNTTVSNSRLQYEEVTPENDIITTDDASIVWHIAPSGDYWTIYSADADAYAAGTGSKNQAQMLSDGTDDKALWTVSGNETYEFINKNNNANNVNKNLRNNGTNGFACYSTQTGGALSLYKRASATITLAASGYASYCCDKALDFSTNSKSVYRAWYVSDVTGTTVTFSEITGKVKAGEGIILYGTPGAKCSLPYANNGEELTGNMLRGTLEPTEVTTEMVIDGQSYTLFGLSNGQFVKMKNGTVKANKAFLPILTSQVPTGSNARLDIVFSEETDGIKSIENGKLTIDNSVYDLQGRRVETMKKGSLYIVNGKKFVSK